MSLTHERVRIVGTPHTYADAHERLEVWIAVHGDEAATPTYCVYEKASRLAAPDVYWSRIHYRGPDYERAIATLAREWDYVLRRAIDGAPLCAGGAR